MSKIGRKPIDIGTAKIEVKGQEVHYSGKKRSGIYILPDGLTAQVDGKMLSITSTEAKAKKTETEINRNWGLHRALLANMIKGSQADFEKNMQINGLGYKAAVSGNKVVFSLGYSHKINFDLPKDIGLEVDKTGQRLTFRSPDKELLGLVCSQVRSLRPPEPYKGTGIKYESEVIARKAGKTKAA